MLSFIEKPKSDGWISAGFFVFKRKVFDYLDGDDCILEREPLERLAARRPVDGLSATTASSTPWIPTANTSS